MNLIQSLYNLLQYYNSYLMVNSKNNTAHAPGFTQLLLKIFSNYCKFIFANQCVFSMVFEKY
jgi:hypothetical protein